MWAVHLMVSRNLSRNQDFVNLQKKFLPFAAFFFSFILLMAFSWLSLPRFVSCSSHSLTNSRFLGIPIHNLSNHSDHAEKESRGKIFFLSFKYTQASQQEPEIPTFYKVRGLVVWCHEQDQLCATNKRLLGQLDKLNMYLIF